MILTGIISSIITFVADPGVPIEMFKQIGIEELKKEAELNQRFKFCRICKVY